MWAQEQAGGQRSVGTKNKGEENESPAECKRRAEASEGGDISEVWAQEQAGGQQGAGSK